MYDELNNPNNGNYYNTDGGYTHYDSTSHLQKPEQKKKKKGGFGRTMAKCLVLALVFGSASSLTFMGTNYIGRQVLGDAVTVDDSALRASLSKSDQVSATTVAGSSSDVYDVSDIVTNCMPLPVSLW